jgi:hypothetical protein
VEANQLPLCQVRCRERPVVTSARRSARKSRKTGVSANFGRGLPMSTLRFMPVRLELYWEKIKILNVRRAERAAKALQLGVLD